jgi:hypothetical protein
MISLGIKSDVDKLSQAFTGLASKQVPFATSLALNRTAFIARDSLKRELYKVFDRPTPFTVNSLYTIPSTKSRLTAVVEHKDFAGKGTPASKYLRAEIEGGSRGMKRSEVALAAKTGFSKLYYNPSKYTERDAYGSMSGAQIVKLLSNLQAFGEQGYRANLTGKTKKNQRKRGTYRDLIIIRAGNARGLKPGVYERFEGELTRRLKPVLFFSLQSHTYRRRYDMNGIVNRIVDLHFGAEFAKAMDFALSTAKLNVRG